MSATAPSMRFGPVEVYLGDKSGKYPDGNQLIVQGADTRVAFDTPLVANTLGDAFDGVDMVVLGHVHEDHMAGLHRVPRAAVQVHKADLAAAQSWHGLAAHYGYEQPVLDALKPMIDRDFHYHPCARTTCPGIPVAIARWSWKAKAWLSSATST